ncbi:NADH-quinone oxidoreductase subunit L [Candidatus Poribacteria bacterium]|nr:NADH-quinone oxidoreductase subunit L [Candidatus Poribacteria bacterium]MYB65751.1 NADH-quinone oxidoreductase subunit L [Candidatus Poribacteria bacterium]MYF56688.1 NADH-quinone oxidoreductase subunit L [Candidatus Poribacteria bacterium]MYI93976.1 NADH-quinone oxidoreductase subunit L [Candidatus Poribacteria bacterium]
MVVPLISIILLSPLVAFAIFALSGLAKRSFPRQDLLSTAAMLIALVCSFFLLRDVVPDPEPLAVDWVSIGEITISMGFYLDSVTVIMLIVVTLVSSLVHIFSIGYMHGDPRYPRFFAYLSLFSFSMLFLVVSDNLLGIYIGWELVGLCSYLLIGFWFEKDSAANACKKAFLTTRVGDIGMFIGMMMLFKKFNTFSLYDGTQDGIFTLAAAQLTTGDMVWLSIAGILIFCGAIGKSAQVPLHTWLPDAMEGPTPVSALIHAATMVAAGVYLTARMFPILTVSSSLVIAYVGGITAIVAATIAIVRFDIKRVLAYSTVSQLGYMMLAIGAGSYVAGLFHLTTHAFFKALLFLGSGSVIHAFHAMHSHSHDEAHADDEAHEHDDHSLVHEHGSEIPPDQDMRNMGGLRRKMPITFITMLIATLSISGVPFVFSGFWSKDKILAGVLGRAMEWNSIHHYILFGIALLAACITAFYMFRLIFMTFFGEPRNQEMHNMAHESPWVMTAPLIILAVLSFPVVNHLWFNKNYVIPPEQHHLAAPQHAYVSPDTKTGDANFGFSFFGVSDAQAADEAGGKNGEKADEAYHIHKRAHDIAMALSIIVAGLGILLSWLFYHRRRFSAESVATTFRPVYNLFWHKYYFDEFYDGVLVALTVWKSRLFARFDLSVIDGIVNGVSTVTRRVFAAFIGFFDNSVVDGIVNRVAEVTWAAGGRIRRIQTGAIQTYLFVVIGGIVLIILIFRAL